ncbi:MAG: hypothetical protein OEU92_00440 [Alphaproteobacteria bacterium]|nr:hypothetical protein [Alphaproteobacteria bacterium]
MATEGSGETNQTAGQPLDEPVPFMQRLLDNPFLLLFLGVALPAVLYLMWGLMELTQVPLAQ